VLICVTTSAVRIIQSPFKGMCNAWETANATSPDVVIRTQKRQRGLEARSKVAMRWEREGRSIGRRKACLKKIQGEVEGKRFGPSLLLPWLCCVFETRHGTIRWHAPCLLSLRRRQRGIMTFRGTAKIVAALPAIAVAASLSVGALTVTAPAWAQDSKTYVMKLSTATKNDPQEEWLRRFVAAVDKDSGGRIKGEIYNASQLGSIPRQIEGTQFGAIQAWIGPPEFLVGIDERYEALSAPGLFTSFDQDAKTINDPQVRDLMLGLGANKGLAGIAIMPTGASSFVVRKPVHHLAEFDGMKIRVLASQFQLEMIKRMGASPVAMSLGDVMPALQQGAIDGALGTIPVFVPLKYSDVTKYMVQTEQPYVNVVVVMSKKWLEALPPDLQKIVRDDATSVSNGIIQFAKDFITEQEKAWTDQGGELLTLPPDEQAALIAKISSIGPDVSKDKPELNKAVEMVFAAAAKNK
jgi:TRAP-type C4-dicarboxylate transport system substrate-binding protein